MVLRELPCPRCAHPSALSGDRDGVYSCSAHGVFVRPEHAANLRVMLERIPESKYEAMRSPEHGTGVLDCPGCGARPRALSFFEVPIDWCPSCGGVWLDRGELEALRERVAALRAQVRDDAFNPYRARADVAARAVVLGTVTCPSCSKTVPINQTYMTGEGVLCVPCGRAKAGELPSAQTEAEVNAWLEGRKPVPAPDWLSRMLDSLLGPN
jgi:Zn-finger nucleic acid-binding protein